MKDNIGLLLLISTCSVFLVLVIFILIFIRHQKKLSQNKADFQEAKIIHQQALLKNIVLAQENERKRIGEDLHDEVGSSLARLRFIIEIFIHNKQPSMDEFTHNCKTLIDKIIDEVRGISHNLSPIGLLTNGLVNTLRESCLPIVKTGLLNIEIYDDSEGLTEKLNLLESISIYRIVTELIQNTIKHAHAKMAQLNITTDLNYLTFDYQDDGIGLVEHHGNGMGTKNIKNRLTVIGATEENMANTGKGYGFRFKLKIS